MPSWKDILQEIKVEHQRAQQTASTVYDTVRRKHLAKLAKKTKRNIIIYYSGWLQKEELFRRGFPGFSVNDADKNGFMTTIYALNRSLGLDLILHTPGGSLAATESLVYYLRKMFGTNIRAFVPQIAMSAGTMLACACKEIWMGEHSCLGPIDPQVKGIAAHGVREEFERAGKEIKEDSARIPLWQPILAKYEPSFIGECEKALEWTKEIVQEWLISGMFKGEQDAKKKARKIIKELGDHVLTKSHARHIDLDQAERSKLKIRRLEEDQELQDAILNVHHCCIQTLGGTAAYKIIENHKGIAFIQQIKVIPPPQ